MRSIPFDAIEYVDLLVAAFGDEYTRLTTRDRRLVVEDYHEALIEDRCSVAEYRRRIGKGNLASYVACLRVGADRRVS